MTIQKFEPSPSPSYKVPLSKITLKTTKNGLEFSKTKSFIELLHQKHLKINDEFAIKEFDYIVLYSEPFRKGTITNSTEIVCILDDVVVSDELYGTGLGGFVEIELDDSGLGFDCYCSWDTLTLMGIFDKDYILVSNRLTKVNGRENGRRGVLHFNRQDYINIQRTTTNIDRFEWQPTNLTYESTPFATQITISAIQTPSLTDIIYNQTLNLLKSHLLEERIYKLNDILSFPISKSKAEFIDLLQLTNNELLATLDFNDFVWVLFRIETVVGNHEFFKINHITRVVESAKIEPGLIKTKNETCIDF